MVLVVWTFARDFRKKTMSIHKMVVHKFSIFLGPVDMAAGENVLDTSIYGRICADVTLHTNETVVRGSQGISKIYTIDRFLTYQM